VAPVDYTKDVTSPLLGLFGNDDQNPTQSIHSQGDEALFTRRVWVFDRERHRVAKRLLCVAEADAVPPKVGQRFGRVELEVHVALCIRNAYLQASYRGAVPKPVGTEALISGGLRITIHMYIPSLRLIMKTERVTLLTSPDFKAFLNAEARREGVSVAELVRTRCERRPTDEETVLAGLTSELNRAVGEAKIALKDGLDEAQAVLGELRTKRAGADMARNVNASAPGHRRGKAAGVRT
jgi:hypothetical protein